MVQLLTYMTASVDMMYHDMLVDGPPSETWAC